MRKNFGVKPLTVPQPVFIVSTYNEDGTANAMNVAWGGVSEENELTLCIDNGHKTAENLVKQDAFVVHMGEAGLVLACDYLGVVSGNKVSNKIEVANLHTSKSPFVNAPIIEEFTIAVECRLISYDADSCRCIGEIVNVSVDERVLNEAGEVDMTKVNPIVFDAFNHDYLSLGEKVGKAFKDGFALPIPSA